MVEQEDLGQIRGAVILLEQAADTIALERGTETEGTKKLRVCAVRLQAIVARHEPCPTCPPRPATFDMGHMPMVSFSTFGPCPDGKHHDTTCPVARAAMMATKWPCGRLQYPELSASTTVGDPRENG
jgi:hypothetical protein